MINSLPKGGFSFDLYNRNQFLESKGVNLPTATKTGTTIVGMIFNDGVVLGADTRATSGPIVADKNCEKIHFIAPNMYCCGAGTAADTESITGLISGKLELMRLHTGRDTRVVTALTMLKQMLFKYQGHIGAALILGGVDVNGPHLFSIAPHGDSSTDKLPFVTMGSGSLNAMAVFEARYRRGMQSGIFNDLGSGSNVDVCVLTANGVEYLRNYRQPNVRPVKQLTYAYPRGATAVLSEKIIDFRSLVQVEEMDTTS